MIKTILWDFDGVLINSNEVRTSGFWVVLTDYPKEQVSQLIDYHKANGGLSRYVKFRYFFETVRGERIEQERLDLFCKQFSDIMKSKLTDKKLLISETVNFIVKNHVRYNMHIVSGSDEEELKWLCDFFNISQYFKSIHGSPTPKDELVYTILRLNNYTKKDCILIGDSINDYQAAYKNKIDFQSYNNKSLEKFDSKNIIKLC